MNLQTKADFTALMHKFLDPLKPCYSAGCARLHLGETGVTYNQNAIELEAFSRPLWALGGFGGAMAVTLLTEWYGTAFRYNYPIIERQGGSTVNGGEQLAFVLRNPLRTIAAFWGTLGENDFFIGQLGLFGWKDLPISFLNLTGPLVLLLAALLAAAQPKRADAFPTRRRVGGAGRRCWRWCTPPVPWQPCISPIPR